MGALGGILIVDYWIIRRQQLLVDDLFRTDGAYQYWHGVNPRAVIALVLGVLPVVPGFLRAATTPGGIVANPGLLDTLYAYAWFVTFALSALLYGILMRGQHARPADRPGIR
jgi:NCS1 family nucleobase:cation symporter-1